MGMFDSLQCNYPLPLPLEVIDYIPDIYSQELQTKDLDCLMDLYILDENGKIQKEERTYKWVDDDNSFLKGYFETTSKTITDTGYHGIINFYMYERVYDENDKNKGKDISIDFIGKFSDGNLMFIEILDYSVEDASERIYELKELLARNNIKRNLWYNKYFLNTRPIRFIRNKIVKSLYFLHNLTGKLHSLAIRYI